ncbi:MAG: triose-phosphate isomerase [Neisseriaceae bacterium]|nr:triose-phosphate isomerase [Neisseriaceae bacterium]MBP6862349.1 triose-phosphate isomerase [Neisseriaceae bacterium]
MAQKKWILGNWKMNGRVGSNAALLAQFADLPVGERVVAGIAAPMLYVPAVVKAFAQTPFLSGAQDVSQYAQDGAFTGEVSAAMLKDVGTDFVLIGHSERRQYFQEGHDLLRTKLENALQAGVTPVLCVGEPLEDRLAERQNEVVADQLNVLNDLPAELIGDELVVAYEPVWAIGTGQVASLAQIADMHEFIYAQILSKLEKAVKIRILYGGSVNADNARDIFCVSKVGGALVGGASLSYESFAHILKVAQES